MTTPPREPGSAVPGEPSTPDDRPSNEPTPPSDQGAPTGQSAADSVNPDAPGAANAGDSDPDALGADGHPATTVTPAPPVTPADSADSADPVHPAHPAAEPSPEPIGGSASPAGDRIEPGGESVASGEGSQPREHSPTAETPDLADPPPDYDGETTPGQPAESDDWDAPVTSIPSDSEAARPVTAIPAESLPIPMPPVTRAPLGSAFGYPARFANAPGTGYHLALPQLGTIAAGSAVGSMISGIGATIVAIGAACSLFLGPLISAASSILAVFCAGAAILLAGLGMRQIRRGGGEFRGTGMAITGLCCAGFALVMALFVLLVSLLR